MSPGLRLAVGVGFIIGCIGCSTAAIAQTTLAFDNQTGLFKIGYHTLEVVKSNFVFWHDQWAWTDVGVKGQANGVGQYALASTSKQGRLGVSGTAARTAPNELTWTLRFSEGSGSGDWGGISFGLSLDQLGETNFEPMPKLLTDNSGWELEIEPNKPSLQVRFSPPPASISFERGNKGELRVYFNKSGQPLPSGPIVMTVRLPPGGELETPRELRLAAPDPNSWYPNLTFFNRSPVDLSFLNERPAGSRGFLKAGEGGELSFQDGRPVRFWGTNLTAYALFKTDSNSVRVQARRLSQLGFNLVRIHHHDSEWVDPNIFGSKPASTRRLDPESLAQLDWWIKCLKDEGIYVWLDLDVGRRYTRADDIDLFGEIARGAPSGDGKGFAYFNKSIRARMKEFAAAYLTHVNAYTGLSYKDDPTIAFVLLTNENDVTHHFGNNLLPDKHVPEHNAIYMREANEFAESHSLDPDKTWRSWEPGASKIFLNDVEHRFNAEMIAYLHKLGVRVPIATTNSWGEMTLAGLPSLTDGDVVDAHAYAEPDFLTSDPRYSSNSLQWMAAASVIGKPLTVTEWNMAKFPSVDRSALPTYLASIASFQGWSALMEFAYTQGSLDRPDMPGDWNMVNDPTMLAMMPAAALLYRRGDVSQGAAKFLLSPTADALMGQSLSPKTSRAIRTLPEKSRLRVLLPDIKELSWLIPAETEPGDRRVQDFARDFSAGGQTRICADNGAFCRNWEDGVFTVQTPRSQLASGWIGGTQIEMQDATFLIDTAFATVAIQSLDEHPIRESEHLLISMAAQSLRSPQEPKNLLSEPVLGSLKLRSAKGLRAFRLTADGLKEPISAIGDDGSYTIKLDRSIGSYWVLLEKR